VSLLARDPAKGEALRKAGASVVAADALDRDSVVRAFEAARPEVVVNELTSLSGLASADGRRGIRDAYAANDRIRRVGYANVLEASRRVGVRRLVAQSSAFWYAPDGTDAPKSEEARWWTDLPDPVGAAVRTMAEAERALLASDRLEGVALRYGVLFGPGTAVAPDGGFATALRRRMLPIVGSGAALSPFVHVEDAAEATARFVEAGAPGAYNVAGEAARADAWMPALARAIGAPPPRRIPEWVAALAVGRGLAAWLAREQAAASGKAEGAVGWRAKRSWRDGFA